MNDIAAAQIRMPFFRSYIILFSVRNGTQIFFGIKAQLNNRDIVVGKHPAQDRP
jgi:hypothetical protein